MMSRWHGALMLAMGLLCLMVSQAARGESVRLVHEGKPAATIVIQPKAAAREKQAARDLQLYVEKISGVKLPIRADGKAVKGTGLYIGRCEPTRDSDFPAADLNPESYAITVRDGNIHFTGNQPTPTYFAVTSFIEEDLGVRWFAPGDLWTHIPKSETPGELTVEVASRVESPDVSPRSWSGHSRFPSQKAWVLSNKAVRSERTPWTRFQNNMHTIFPPSKYGKTHPEYYPLGEQSSHIMTDGGRQIPPDDRYRQFFPCTSNPEVVRVTVEHINQWFTDHPEESTFSLGQDDIRLWCRCDGCRALDADPTDYDKKRTHRGVFSDRYYKFVNDVAAEVRKTHPDRYIGVLIYNVAEAPPTRIDKLEDNVFGYLTQHSFNWFRPERRQADEALAREWAKRCKNLSRYSYYGLNVITPRYAPSLVDSEFKLDHELGFQGMYIEFKDFYPNTVPMIWATAKLQWDRTLSMDALLDEFMTKMYGDVAPIMTRYWQTLEQAWLTDHPGRPSAGMLRNFAAQVGAMRAVDLDRAVGLLDQALAATTDPAVRQRIEIHRDGLHYGGYGIWLDDLAKRIMARSVTDRASADRVLALATRQASLLAEAEAFWSQQTPERDDLLGMTLRGWVAIHEKWQDTFIQIARSMALTAAGANVVDALDWYAQYAPHELDSRTEALKAAHARYAQMAQTVRETRAHRPVNLLKNGDFEQPADVSPDFGGAVWTLLGAPADWLYWARFKEGRWGIVDGQGIEGSRAALLQHDNDSNALNFKQAIPVQPNDRYLVITQARSATGQPTRADIEIYLATEAQGYYVDQNVNLTVGDTWQPITFLVDTPEQAKTLLVVLYARGANGLLYDNVQVHRITK